MSWSSTAIRPSLCPVGAGECVWSKETTGSGGAYVGRSILFSSGTNTIVSSPTLLMSTTLANELPAMSACDADAWTLYPQHRAWFDKLQLSLRLGYNCGPAGTAPISSGRYVVRPTYNLSGMGVGARIEYIAANSYTAVDPGYFWCEVFPGEQHSVDYRWDQQWVATSSWRATRGNTLSRFVRWDRAEFFPELPPMFDDLHDVGTINIEFIGDKIIEVHLRPSPDPQDANTLIPVWADQPHLTSLPNFVAAYDDADEHLKIPRLGFLIE